MSEKRKSLRSPEVDRLARIVWDYHHVDHDLEKADVIFVLGSHDLRVAERGAELYLEGWAPRIVFSGGLGALTRESFDEPEADKFARLARERGVPADAILIENQSTHTGENVLFTKRLLEQHGVEAESFILVQKPYMERRTLATFKKRWPEKTAMVTSPQIDLDDYCNEAIPKEKVIAIMVGDLQRIREYPARGFQIEQTIPSGVWDAYERLVELGFTEHLIRD